MAQHSTTPGALRVTSWHLAAFRRLWKMNVLSSLVQPLLYLLGLGVGVGSLVDRNTGSGAVLGTSSYVAFVKDRALPTLDVRTGARVLRVAFGEGRRAAGIEYEEGGALRWAWGQARACGR